MKISARSCDLDFVGEMKSLAFAPSLCVRSSHFTASQSNYNNIPTNFSTSHPRLYQLNRRRCYSQCIMVSENSNGNGKDPILLRCARGEQVERPPVWLMRQAGRYMAAFREYSDKYPFRKRSETPDIALELSLQPWRAFRTDGVIMFSDILTPLPAFGVEFDMVKGVGPKIMEPIRSLDQIKAIVDVEFVPGECLGFVKKVLEGLRDEVGMESTVLGFVGAPFTLAAYMIEGGAKKNLDETKRMMCDDSGREGLKDLLMTLSEKIAKYAIFQIEAGAQVVQIFDSWAHHLTPQQYESYSLPYVREIVERVKRVYPNVPLIFFANGSGGKLEKIWDVLHTSRNGDAKLDVVSLDWSVSMTDARKRLGTKYVMQGNVDPVELLVGDAKTVKSTVIDCIEQAGTYGHILNLGHGVIQGTPEANVAAFCAAAREYVY